MSKVSYPYAVGRIRALESGLIDPARWSRLREATREEAIRILSEAGYGNASSDPEQMIRAQEEETVARSPSFHRSRHGRNCFCFPSMRTILKSHIRERCSARMFRTCFLRAARCPPI